MGHLTGTPDTGLDSTIPLNPLEEFSGIGDHKRLRVSRTVFPVAGGGFENGLICMDMDPGVQKMLRPIIRIIKKQL